jgi:uncharacterized membrane protein
MPEFLLSPYLIGGFYLFAGFSHFVKPRVYEAAIPPSFGNQKVLNQLAGIAEVLIGTGFMVEYTIPFAATGAIALLFAVFPAHIYTYRIGFMGIPKWLMLLRMPVQLLLIYWAYLFI